VPRGGPGAATALARGSSSLTVPRQDRPDRPPELRATHLEDAVILAALVPLFVLGVFFRDTWWGQAGLIAVLAAMAAVFFFRLRRVHRAFTGREGGSAEPWEED